MEIPKMLENDKVYTNDELFYALSIIGIDFDDADVISEIKEHPGLSKLSDEQLNALSKEIMESTDAYVDAMAQDEFDSGQRP
jgi:hypothetical protein